DTFTFSTDENTAAFLREAYPDVITKGWHCPPVQAKYKSSVALSDVDDATLEKFADMSYDRALSKL
ncbi:MAG: MmcQ/YjbR family DNA-binding protein, partial [Clostridia bacterium]|nr:MmcQ/YjbR family DNA-binding protein [Clostridia bacterium]